MSDPGTTRDRGAEARTHPPRSLLHVLGNRIVAVLGGVVRSAHVGIGTVYVIGFTIVVVVLLAGGLLDPVVEWIRSARDQDAFGKIIVESPEVYTRERLVNDRLRQTVWLRKQMHATENVLKEGEFRSHEGQWTQDVATAVTADLALGGRVGHTGNAKGSNLPRLAARSGDERNNGNAASTMNHPEIGASIELFRAMNEYREQIRTELMQTQLDDRHDIDGNTLYRLNFNTTVVHGRRSDALAVVLVRLEHSKGQRDPGEILDTNLLRDWAQELEKRLGAAARSRLGPLLTPLSPISVADSTEFYLWLRWKICKTLTRVAFKLSASEGRASHPSPGTIGALRTWFVVHEEECGKTYYEKLDQGDHEGGDSDTGDATNEKLAGRLDRFIRDYVNRYREAKRVQNVFWKYVEARPEVVKEVLKRLPVQQEDGVITAIDAAPNSLDFFRELAKKWCNTLTTLRFYDDVRRIDRKTTQEHSDEAANGETMTPPRTTPERIENGERDERNMDSEREKDLVQGLCNPGPTRSPPPQLVIEGVMDLYWHLEHLEVELSSNPKNGPSDSKRLEEIDCSETTTDQIEKTLENQSMFNALVPVESWLKRERKAMEELLSAEDGLVCMLRPRPDLWRRNLVIQYEVDDFNRTFIDGEVKKADGTGVLAGIIRVKAVGCGVELCRISVELESKAENAAECFFRILDDDFEVFSYGVTPKNWHQRLAFSSSVVDKMAVALGPPAMTGTKNKSTLFEGVHRDRQNLRSIMSRPVVIGFGRGRTKRWDITPGTNLLAGCEPSRSEVNITRVQADRPAADGPWKPHQLNRETEFGWFIAPEKRWSEEGGNWHPHRQYDLSAVISVPSWWRRVKLTVSSCWRTLNELENLGDEYIEACRSGDGDGVRQGTGGVNDDSYFIKLPGDVSEISRKLRIDVIEVPYILTQMYSPELGHYEVRAGKPASIVIEGGRLWRSTRVTLGTQPADQIEVLPHMEGIVATFDCVRRPPYPKLDERLATSIRKNLTDFPGGIFPAPLKVWTSEGVTDPALPVYVVAADPKDAKPCPDEIELLKRQSVALSQ